MSVKHGALGAAAGGGVVAIAVAFTPIWEGMDPVAKVDRIGTGHPITYCYGQTDEFGAVKAGQRFTKAECDAKLAESLPKYLAKITPCIKVDIPDESMAALLDAAYNAGPAAVCRSPMVAKINAGDLKGGCEAFHNWYVRSDGVVRKGLINRRDGDSRKGEKELCLEGIPSEREFAEAKPAPVVVPTPVARPAKPKAKPRRKSVFNWFRQEPA